jgi:DNA-binding IclR family transcriptional regulator
MRGDYNQYMIRRALKIMFMLSDTSHGYSVRYLAGLLGISQRAIYRYLNMFENLGFTLEKSNFKYKITNFNQLTNGNNQKGLPS